jgi:hypothetical protein
MAISNKQLVDSIRGVNVNDVASKEKFIQVFSDFVRPLVAATEGADYVKPTVSFALVGAKLTRTDVNKLSEIYNAITDNGEQGYLFGTLCEAVENVVERGEAAVKQDRQDDEKTKLNKVVDNLEKTREQWEQEHIRQGAGDGLEKQEILANKLNQLDEILKTVQTKLNNSTFIDEQGISCYGDILNKVDSLWKDEAAQIQFFGLQDPSFKQAIQDPRQQFFKETISEFEVEELKLPEVQNWVDRMNNTSKLTEREQQKLSDSLFLVLPQLFPDESSVSLSPNTRKTFIVYQGEDTIVTIEQRLEDSEKNAIGSISYGYTMNSDDGSLQWLPVTIQTKLLNVSPETVEERRGQLYDEDFQQERHEKQEQEKLVNEEQKLIEQEQKIKAINELQEEIRTLHKAQKEDLKKLAQFPSEFKTKGAAGDVVLAEDITNNFRNKRPEESERIEKYTKDLREKHPEKYKGMREYRKIQNDMQDRGGVIFAKKEEIINLQESSEKKQQKEHKAERQFKKESTEITMQSFKQQEEVQPKKEVVTQTNKELVEYKIEQYKKAIAGVKAEMRGETPLHELIENPKKESKLQQEYIAVHKLEKILGDKNTYPEPKGRLNAFENEYNRYKKDPPLLAVCKKLQTAFDKVLQKSEKLKGAAHTVMDSVISFASGRKNPHKEDIIKKIDKAHNPKAK